MDDQTAPDPHPPRKPQRFSFLLRLWRETGRSDWRASLEMPGTGERTGFASLEQLFMYLVDCCEAAQAAQVGGPTQPAREESPGDRNEGI